MAKLTQAQGLAIHRARRQLHEGFAARWPGDVLSLLVTLHMGAVVELLATPEPGPLVDAINQALEQGGVRYRLAERAPN